VSEPQLPDAEKLSWLVLGHGLSDTSGAQVDLLQSAAAALLAQGAAAGIQSHITSALGIDSISVGRSQDNLQQRIVSVSKRVSSRLFLSYQHGLQTAGSTVLLRYMLSPRITIEAETGVRSVFSLFYNFSFD
jgi:translocation and assembly module TamB